MKKVCFLIIAILLIISSVALAKSFSDLQSDHWAYTPINEMTNKGILSGYPDGSFEPDKAITRAEFAKILVLTLDLKDDDSKNIFADVDSSYWGYNYIKIASNYLSGYSNGNVVFYRPEDKAVREDVAVAVVLANKLESKRYIKSTLNKITDSDQISNNFQKYVAIAIENDLMHGYPDGSFKPKGTLTRAEVCQLMSNLTENFEKVVVNDKNNNSNNGSNNSNNSNNNNFKDDEEEDELPNIVYDASKGSVDLGENWNKYYYSYNLAKKPGTIYTPTQRVLSYTNYETIGKTFEGNYFSVILKSDKSQYKTIKITDPFENINFDFENGQINLGSDYSKYVYSYGYTNSRPTGGIKYSPSQRVLKGNGETQGMSSKNGYQQNTGFPMDKDIYVTVYLLSNTSSFHYRAISDIYINNGNNNDEKDELPNIVYDASKGSVDLGENWNKYYYSYNLSKKPGSIYTPTQRVLSYTNYETIGKTFEGNYFSVILKSDKSQYKTIKVTDPFENINFDFENGQINLGSDYSKYVYSYGYTNSRPTGGIKYSPSQRVLKGNGETQGMSSKNGYQQNTGFPIGKDIYVTVYLLSNSASFHYRAIPDIYINNGNNNDEKDELPNIVYDASKGSVDLGENWNKYYYSYNLSKKPGSIYTPTQRVLSYTNYETVGKTFEGNYFSVILKSDKSQYKTIKVTDPFENIDFDYENGQVDLGSNYTKYIYSNPLGNQRPTGGTKYSPSQRVLKGNKGFKSEGRKNGFELYDGFDMSEKDRAVTVYLLSNPASFKYSPISDIYVRRGYNDNLDDIEYDINTGTVDLGENWKNYVYKFSISASGKDSATIYTPSQRVLSYNQYNIEKQTETFCGNYLYIMDKNNTKVIKKTLNVEDPLKDIEFNFDDGEIDLGSNYSKYVYSFSYNKAKGGNKYTPSQRVLKGNGETQGMSSKNGYQQNTGFPMDKNIYVTVYLRSNLKSYRYGIITEELYNNSKKK